MLPIRVVLAFILLAPVAALPAQVNVEHFAVDAVDPSRLFAVTYFPTRLLVSSDGGRSWRRVDDGRLADLSLTSLGSVPSPAGSTGRGGVLPERVSSVASALSTREDAVAACNPDPVTLCLGDGRFAITIDWKDLRGRVGVGHSHALNGTTGYFWFFDEENVEIAISTKVPGT
jgi:hypothetical protein